MDLATADLDSDGRRELIAIGGQVAFYRALPGGGFAAPVVYAGAGGDGNAIRDLTGDLRPTWSRSVTATPPSSRSTRTAASP